MLDAAEAAMEQAAADDAERARNRAKLYAPPAGAAPRRAAGRADTGGGMGRAQAQALMARLAAEDARYSR